MIKSNNGLTILTGKDTEHFSLKKIHASGQLFRSRLHPDGTFSLVAMDRLLVAKQTPERIIMGCDIKEFDDVWSKYFDLWSRAYSVIIGDAARLSPRYPGNRFIQQAVEFSDGIRILRQDPFETSLSFIISQNNNIPRIRNIVCTLCKMYGERRCKQLGRRRIWYYTFPSADALRGKDLSALNLGYRLPYVQSFIDRWPCDISYDELIGYEGIGPKVASCIDLFANHNMRAFPIDTWIERCLNAYFPDGLDLSLFHHPGLLQQAMFFYGRSNIDLWRRNNEAG